MNCKTPRKSIRSIVSDKSPFDAIVNDDEAERACRRSCLELQRRVSNIGTLNRSTSTTPGTGNASDTDSCAISEASLEDHYQTCVKLFTENKINTKNAWNLHIIEYMRAMMSKGLVMKETLKLASTSLDIGSKVYGLRVDDIHNNMLKLASAMARINVEADEDDGEPDDPQETSRTEGEAAKKKPEKKKRKRIIDDDVEELTIAKDESTLNGKIIPHNTQCIGATSTAQDRLNTLSCLNKQKFGWEQLVNCRTNFQYWTPLKNVQPAPHLIPVSITVPSMDGILCPSFENFVIDQWSPDNDDVPCGTQFPRPQSDEVIYDENGLPIPELDGSIHGMNDDHFEDPFEQSGDDIVEEVCNGQTGIKKPVTFITSMRPGDGPLSDKPLQYCYRAVPVVSERYGLTGVWAGPAHWKIKCLQRPATQPIRETIQGAPQRGKRVRKIGPKPVTFFAEDFEERWTDDGIKILRLQKSTLDKYSLPEDHCLSEANTKTFCMRPWLYAEIRGLESQQHGNANLNMSTIYQYDNPNDAEYCSQTMTDIDDAANTIADAEAVHEDDENDDDPNTMFQDDNNMDDMPNTVPTITVPYATRAKKMDMKKLKEAIWKTMAIIETGNTDVIEDEQILNNIQFHEIKFSEIYKTLPSLLPHRMTEELSYPMAFVAVLHLANEQSLHLEGQPDLLDFKITK